MVAKAYKAFSRAYDGCAVSLGGMCLVASHSRVHDKLIRLCLRSSATGEEFVTQGYGSQSFLKEASLCSEGRGGVVKIAGKKMEWQKQSGRAAASHAYVLEVEEIGP